MPADTRLHEPFCDHAAPPEGPVARLRRLIAALAPAALLRRWQGEGPARRPPALRRLARAAGPARPGPGPEVPRGRIVLVGAGPGAADLLTLRGVRHLQEADAVFYDRLVDPALLDLARPGAVRVHVGKAVGAHAWPQERINAAIVAAARRGLRVVRLKSGDPGIFGRAAEELAAARAAGIAVEIVPGVTAASAAAASLGRSLTERGQSDTLVLTTGTCRPGDPPPDWAARFRPGTVLALYMAVAAAAEVQAQLLAAGAPPDCPVQVVFAAQTAREEIRSGRLATLAATCAGLEGVSLLLIDWPKGAARPRAPLSQADPQATVAILSRSAV